METCEPVIVEPQTEFGADPNQLQVPVIFSPSTEPTGTLRDGICEVQPTQTAIAIEVAHDATSTAVGVAPFAGLAIACATIAAVTSRKLLHR